MDWQAVREEFPITRNYNFQNHAAVAPLCNRAVTAAQAYLNDYRDAVYLKEDYYRKVEETRHAAAKMLNARDDEVTFVKNTSEGLSFVANGLNWQSGDNIVTTNVEFPANVYPWLNLRSRGVELQVVMEENNRIPVERLCDAINSRTRLVAISAVQYASGFRVDLATLGRFCKSKGVLLCVDGIQAIGVLPLDVRAMEIDFLSADSHKWLCGPEGAGVFYVRKEMQGFLRPTTVGWLCMKDALDFGKLKFEFLDSARRYDSGAFNLVGIVAMGGAISLWNEIGVENVSNRLLELTDMLAEGARAKGWSPVRSTERAERSGIVPLASELHDVTKLHAHLQNEHRLIVSVRGGRLRVSPHVYNTEKEIQQLIDALPTH